MDLLLRDQALGLALADLGLALVVDDDNAHRGAAQAGQPLARSERHVELDVFVDDLDPGLHGRDCVYANLSHRAAQRINHAYDDLLGGERLAQGNQCRRQEGPQ